MAVAGIETGGCRRHTAVHARKAATADVSLPGQAGNDRTARSGSSCLGLGDIACNTGRFNLVLIKLVLLQSFECLLESLKGPLHTCRVPCLVMLALSTS